MRESQFSSLFAGIFGWTISLTVVSFWGWSWLGFELPKLLFLSFGLMLMWALLLWRGGVFKLPKDSMWAFFYFFMLLFYTLFSMAPWASALGAGLQQGMFLMVFLLAIHSGEKLLNGRWFMILNGLVSFYAILQFIGLDPLQALWLEENFLGRSFSTLGNPNWLASFIVLTFPVCFKGAKGSWRWFILILNGLALLSTGSKAGFLAAVVLIIVMMPRHRLWVAAGATASFVISLPLFYSTWWMALRSLGSRLLIWKSTLASLSWWPWGHGLKLFTFIFPGFSGPELWEYEAFDVTVQHPHNIFLEKLFEIGPWGLLLFLIMIFVLLRPHWKSPLTLGIVAYLITLCFSFEVLSTGLLFWVFLGILTAKSKSDKILPRRPFAAAGFLLCGAFFLLTLQHTWANHDYEKAIQARDGGEIAKSLEQFDRAISIYPYDRVYLLQASELILALQTTPDEWMQKLDEYLTQLDELSSGLDPELPILLAWRSSKSGWSEDVSRYIENAFSVNPMGVSSYKIALQIYSELGMEEQYSQLRQEFLDALPDYWNDPESEAGRIFRKNNPWIEQL